MRKLALLTIPLSFFLIFSLTKPQYVSAQKVCAPQCVGRCSIGYTCDYCNLAGDSGPATWRCRNDINGDFCCERPESCAGIGECLEDRHKDANRIGCASDPTLCGPTPTKKPPSTPPPGTPLPTQPQFGPFPEPPVPCEEGPGESGVRWPEFHSLRPYQASPCNQVATELALFCGNDLVLPETLTVIKRFHSPEDWDYLFEGDPIDPTGGFTYSHCDPGCTVDLCTVTPQCAGCPFCPFGSCTVINGSEVCWFAIDRSRHFIVDLEDAYLPIMGNTELVINSQRQEEILNDPAKVNEYVSWYLNGVNERAEYPYLDVSTNCLGDSTSKPGYCKPTIANVCMNSLIPPIPVIGYVPDGNSDCPGLLNRCCINSSAQPVETLGRDKLVNFSGPIKKQLSFTSQQKIRIDEIDDAFATINRVTPNPKYQFEQLTEAENPPDPAVPGMGGRHDQVAACFWGIRIPLPLISDLVLGGIPVPCYPYTGLLDLKRPLRLTHWHPETDQSIITLILNFLGTILDSDVFDEITDIFLKQDKIPPQPEDSATVTEYLIKLKEWRGQDCLLFEIPPNFSIISGMQVYLCFENPLPSAANFWSNLFPYIPFSSTEDRKGLVDLAALEVQPISPTLYITNVFLSQFEPADLFFAHMQESAELADILQATYVPQELPKVTFDLPGVVLPDWCDLKEIRNNPGDDLFGTEIEATIDYTANFSCTFIVPGEGRLCGLAGGTCEFINYKEECTIYAPMDCPLFQWCLQSCSALPIGLCDQLPLVGDFDCVPESWSSSCSNIVAGGPIVPYCPTGYICGMGCEGSKIIDPYPIDQECSVELYVRINTLTETPKADEVWSRLVAGQTGVFKRFFPKVEEDAPVQAIMDIPAASPVTYLSNDGVVVAGQPTSGRGATGELYFPHIGGIHQYFLNCIQTMLRPDGFGRKCPQGEIKPDVPPAGDCPVVPDSDIPAKWLGTMKEHYLWVADIWAKPCPGPENNLAEECYNHVVKRSIETGINPAFSLTIWMNETGASNYCYSGPTAQDFGVRDPSIYQNILAQLERFLQLPAAYDFCRATSGWIEGMHAFLSRFKAGGCDPNNAAGTKYYQSVKSFTWPLVTEPIRNCVVGGLFGIAWPNDNSCP